MCSPFTASDRDTTQCHRSHHIHAECARAADDGEDPSKREQAAAEGGKAARTPLQVLAADLAALWRHPVYTVTILGSSVYTGGACMCALVKCLTLIGALRVVASTSGCGDGDITLQLQYLALSRTSMAMLHDVYTFVSLYNSLCC